MRLDGPESGNVEHRRGRRVWGRGVALTGLVRGQRRLGISGQEGIASGAASRGHRRMG